MSRRNWIIGWVSGACTVALAAGLLTELTARARRIAAQAAEIERGLDRARAHTDAMFELVSTHGTIEQATSQLRAKHERKAAR